MTKPITPKEVIKHKFESIPDEVFQAFNEMIQEKWDGHESCFRQEEVVEKIVEKTDYSKKYIFNNHWLDIEEYYRKVGWIVKYDSPGYNEIYPPTFSFRRKE